MMKAEVVDYRIFNGPEELLQKIQELNIGVPPYTSSPSGGFAKEGLNKEKSTVVEGGSVKVSLNPSSSSTKGYSEGEQVVTPRCMGIPESHWDSEFAMPPIITVPLVSMTSTIPTELGVLMDSLLKISGHNKDLVKVYSQDRACPETLNFSVAFQA
ncbi:hypothetical protein CJ030_MR4G028677 [Morella rubra]|uniref:Uncharacterized protein n=1 Tax=Morella rubra TaxID=262757 RepID=A0A6A1VSF2_9ROSI|nr:hypothetical protein CJ030_MR4G028676 [Morella rubra]KAB1215903.1 hypothetical protein CJ030_MR4G028677 [Morella rubra]